jgi:hypothetical protein
MDGKEADGGGSGWGCRMETAFYEESSEGEADRLCKCDSEHVGHPNMAIM